MPSCFCMLLQFWNPTRIFLSHKDNFLIYWAAAQWQNRCHGNFHWEYQGFNMGWGYRYNDSCNLTMWSINLQEKNSSIEPSHLVVIHRIFLLNPQVKIHKREKNQLCIMTGLQAHIHPTICSMWAFSRHRLDHPVASHLCMMAAAVHIKRKKNKKKNMVTCSISTVCNLAMWGATLQLDGNKVSITQWFHLMRQCIWLLLQKASLGDCYCKC